MQGNQRLAGGGRALAPFTPAHAGHPCTSSCLAAAYSFYPCACRASLCGSKMAFLTLLRPLRVQGIQQRKARLVEVSPSTPARAGKPLGRTRTHAPRFFHPCARRETRSEWPVTPAFFPSPLHTQGNRSGRPGAVSVASSTPAHAGKPPSVGLRGNGDPFHPCACRESSRHYPFESKRDSTNMTPSRFTSFRISLR